MVRAVGETDRERIAAIAPLTAGQTRAALGMGGADLDAQLLTILTQAYRLQDYLDVTQLTNLSAAFVSGSLSAGQGLNVWFVRVDTGLHYIVGSFDHLMAFTRMPEYWPVGPYDQPAIMYLEHITGAGPSGQYVIDLSLISDETPPNGDVIRILIPSTNATGDERSMYVRPDGRLTFVYGGTLATGAPFAGGAVASVTAPVTLATDQAVNVTKVGGTSQTAADLGALLNALAAVLAGITSLAAWMRGLFRKDAMNATAKSEVNSGGGAFDEATDSLQAIRDTAPLGTAMRGTDGAYTGTPPSTSAIATAVGAQVTSDHGAGDYSGGGGGDPSGAGTDSVTITVNDADGDPVADAEVWVSSDEDGTEVVAGTLRTGDNGQATFLLDAGVTYYLWRRKAGMNFTNPAEFVAVAD
jgi:hypothetical protein